MIYVLNSYTILAASAVPKGFVDARQVTEKVIGAILAENKVEEGEYRFGTSKARIVEFNKLDCIFSRTIDIWYSSWIK